ncbi:hypothetical protein POM88_047133 [Heracleum sosnowskyi]|uniref:F-box associated beta-propeller type 1 domain-containing protein n=1 Tax=Heracleum sosnowskyi TaxID=360622 RepID=A0AAD8M7L8_9APIA|nr:hypothetical protein POM88_047133 [Heracleum sosnowskyi]
MLHLNKPVHPYRESRHLLLSFENSKNDIIASPSPLITNPPIPNVGMYDRVRAVGSCNGLVCISVSYNHCGTKDDLLFLLWNPAIGQSRFLPKPKCSTVSPSVIFEFGYVPETNDYVIVKLDKEERLRFEVYKSSLDSWRVIDSAVVENHITLKRDESSVFVNGCFHWRSLNYARDRIISYELVSEKVGLIKALDNGVAGSECWKLTVVEDSLAMLFYNYIMFELWIMVDYNVHDSWDLRFRIVDDGNRLLYPLGCLRNGLIMITYEEDYVGVYLHDLITEQKTEISKVPHGWRINGFSSYSETLLPLC